MISETKIDDIFPISNIFLDAYSTQYTIYTLFLQATLFFNSASVLLNLFMN